jgi:hypothetical protein
MIGIREACRLAAAAATCAALLCAGAAGAAAPGFHASNYTFPDGSAGFRLHSSGGPVNPEVIVGFNPQPEPPGIGAFDGAALGGAPGADRTLIALLNPADPLLFNPSTGGSFNFLIGLLFPGDGSVIPLPDTPDEGGKTGFSGKFDGHDVNVTLGFGPGPVDPGSWVGFNPQPDPPGDVLAGQFNFAGREDPWMTFSMSVDDKPLSFSLGVPEPQTWALMIMGFGGAGAMLRSRRRSLAQA